MRRKIFVLGWAVRVVGVMGLAGALAAAAQTQPQAQPAVQNASVRLEVAPGTRASYRVREQFVGIDFPNDAVGTTEAISGAIVIGPGGAVDPAQSRLTIDLRTLRSDQDNRDRFIQTRTLETERFPLAEFVPRRIQGLPNPLPTQGQAGVELAGDMTVHGVTSPVTWRGIATFSEAGAAGRATTTVTYSTFGMTKPQIARLLSVGDDIHLEVEFRFRKAAAAGN